MHMTVAENVEEAAKDLPEGQGLALMKGEEVTPGAEAGTEDQSLVHIADLDLVKGETHTEAEARTILMVETECATLNSSFSSAGTVFCCTNSDSHIYATVNQTFAGISHFEY